MTAPKPPTPIRPPLRHITCPQCNTLIIKARLIPGSELEGKCPKCNAAIIVPKPWPMKRTA